MTWITEIYHFSSASVYVDLPEDACSYLYLNILRAEDGENGEKLMQITKCQDDLLTVFSHGD